MRLVNNLLRIILLGIYGYESFSFGTNEILITSRAWGKASESQAGFEPMFFDNCSNSWLLME